VHTRARDIVRRVRHRPRAITENTFSSAGRQGRLGSRAKSHAPATPPRPRASSGGRMRAPCGPTQWLPGPTHPGRARCGGRSRGPFFSRKLGCASENWPRASFENLKSLFHFPGYFKSMQTSKIISNHLTSFIILLNLRSIQEKYKTQTVGLELNDLN
jgi:hypothetical protein